jgi:AraC-like DNA-binding protein
MDRRVGIVIRQLEAKTSSLINQAQAKEQPDVSVEKISINELAASVNLSASHLRTLFKAETKLTIHQYVKQMKMQRAQELVGNTHLRISEIMTHLKFNDASHFVRDFKKRYGLPPSEYRKAVNGANE